MAYRIKTPIMASDFPDLLDLAFTGKTNEVVKQVIERFTIDDQGNPVPISALSVKEYMALVSESMKALGFTEGND